MHNVDRGGNALDVADMYDLPSLHKVKRERESLYGLFIYPQ